MPVQTAPVRGASSPPPPVLVATDVDPPRLLRCRHCLRSPAVEAAPRVTVGIVIAHASEEAPGPYCRTCGTARTRALSNRTLWLGWWSPLSPFAAVRTLWRNMGILRTLARLPEPLPGPRPRFAEAPHDPGRPVLLRSGMLVFVLVAGLVSSAAALVALVSYLGPVQLEDRCVVLTDGGRSLQVVDSCGAGSDGRIEEIVTGDRRCERPPDLEIVLPEYANNARACIRVDSRPGSQ